MGWFSDFFDDVLGFDPNGGGIFKVARDVLGDDIADDILGMDPNGGGAIKAYNIIGPGLLTAGAAAAAAPLLGFGAGSAAGGAVSTAGATAASDIAFLTANGMSAAEIATAFPELAATGGLTGVGGTAGGIAGGGLSASGTTYGTIAADPSTLGAGGAGLSSNAGLQAPIFTGGGSGVVGGLGMSPGAVGAASAGLSGVFSGLQSYLPLVSSLANIGSGIYGMKLADDAREASDPFASQRPVYAAKLAALEANPGSIVSRPGFQAGLEAIGRKSAASGYYGSGNMAAALSRYSGDFYNQEADRLARLAGAGQTPGAGQALGADLASQSLGSIGYGLVPMLERFIRGG